MCMSMLITPLSARSSRNSLHHNCIVLNYIITELLCNAAEWRRGIAIPDCFGGGCGARRWLSSLAQLYILYCDSEILCAPCVIRKSAGRMALSRHGTPTATRWFSYFEGRGHVLADLRIESPTYVVSLSTALRSARRSDPLSDCTLQRFYERDSVGSLLEQGQLAHILMLNSEFHNSGGSK